MEVDNKVNIDEDKNPLQRKVKKNKHFQIMKDQNEKK